MQKSSFTFHHIYEQSRLVYIVHFCDAATFILILATTQHGILYASIYRHWMKSYHSSAKRTYWVLWKSLALGMELKIQMRTFCLVQLICCTHPNSEQQIGNFQNVQQVLDAKSERSKFGRFFYRFPSGEAGLDVYSRVSSFIPTLVRDCNQYRSAGHDLDNMNIGESELQYLFDDGLYDSLTPNEK